MSLNNHLNGKENAYIYLLRLWQSQYEHLYHTVGVIMLNIQNQYRASSTICIDLLSATYLSSILSASLSIDL